MSGPVHTDPLIGRSLKHYRVEALLGEGGMGVVYRARDTRLHRPVAIKVLKGEWTGDEDRRRRFLREARAAAAVSHPAIAQIYDVDEVEGLIFIAMELIDGETLRRQARGGELPVRRAVEIAVQVAEALARAHGAGIVHRDLKSDNIMISPDGHAKLLDFGLAKLLEPSSDGDVDSDARTVLQTLTQTQSGTVLGTIAYMSPEQTRGEVLSTRSDLFSFGIVFYEMLTGTMPFRGNSPVDTMHAIAFEEARPVYTLRDALPAGAQRIIARCLRKNPQDRYPQTSALVEDLKALLRDLEAGVTRPSSLNDYWWQARAFLESRFPVGPSRAVLIGAVAVLALVLFTGTNIGNLIAIGIIGLLIYRSFRNRRARLLKRFTRRIAKFKEVRAIVSRDNQVSVILDRPNAKLYSRVNDLVHEMNRKRWFDDPLEAAIRDDVSQEELRKVLRESGVIYVRPDTFA